VSFEETRSQREASTNDPSKIRCAACGHVITDRGHAIEMAGAHEHHFVNPGGFAFVIRLYSAAPGCGYAGDTHTHFSWFPGWSWQVAHCKQCRAHVGWIYRLAGDQFHGIIANAVRES
jgi:hypothetical protein